MLQFEALSQSICLENAIRIVQIIDQGCTRFSLRSISVFMPQAAIVALTTLFANLTDLDLPSKTTEILRYIQTLIKVLQTMSESHRMAQDICTVANRLLPPSIYSQAESELPPGGFQSMVSQSPLQRAASA